MFDTARLIPEARSIVEAAAAIYLRHTQPWFVGLLVHGSALKGGFIAGCSDIDLQLFVEEQAAWEPAGLPFETCLAIQRDLAQIDPAPFRYLQCYALSTVLPAGYTGPIPGAYLLLAGRVPVAEATRDLLQQSARTRIATLNPLPSYVDRSLLEHGKGRLAWNIRWLCTDVWPTIYQVLVLQGHDPYSIWNLPKPQAMTLFPPNTALGQTLRAFYQAVQAYYPSEESVEKGLAVITAGVTFLQAVKAWWQEHEHGHESLSDNQ